MKLCALTLSCTLIAVVAAHAGDDFSITHWSVDGGGGRSSGGDFELTGTIGQPDAGAMANDDFTLAGGFWFGDVAATPCPADLDGSGDVGFNDLVSVLAIWGPCSGCPADLDASGDVGFSDLVAVLSAWGPCAP